MQEYIPTKMPLSRWHFCRNVFVESVNFNRLFYPGFTLEFGEVNFKGCFRFEFREIHFPIGFGFKGCPEPNSRIWFSLRFEFGIKNNHVGFGFEFSNINNFIGLRFEGSLINFLCFYGKGTKK